MTSIPTAVRRPASSPVLTRHRAGAGPPLVLLHGLGLNWRAWLPVLDALEAHHDVVALDLPGFGDSAPLPARQRPTAARLTDAVVAELDRLGLDRPAVAGNSLGGWLALEMARRGRASRAVAIAPSGLETPWERAYVIALNELMRVRARVVSPLGRLATAPLPARVALFAGLRSRPERIPPDVGAAELASFGTSPAFQATLLATVGGQLAAGLRDIRVPVRIAYGTADLMLGAFTAPRFAALIPGADLVALPGAGHVPMADAPALVARTITDVTAAP